jgi:hypothetical protein
MGAANIGIMSSVTVPAEKGTILNGPECYSH